MLPFSGALDHITVTTKDGKFPLNQLGQISMKSPQLIVVNMTGFPEVRPGHCSHCDLCSMGPLLLRGPYLSICSSLQLST